MNAKIRLITAAATLAAAFVTRAGISGPQIQLPELPESPPLPVMDERGVKAPQDTLSETGSEIQTVLDARTRTSAESFRQLPPEDPSVQNSEPSPEDLNPVTGFSEGKIGIVRPARLPKGMRVPELPVNNEKFFSAVIVLGSPEINTYTITFNVTGTSVKTYKVKGVYGQTSSTLAVTFADDGSAEIAAQKYITNNTTYGNIWFCPVDLATNTYSLTDPVVCSRDEEGNWSMGAWALVVNHTTDKGYNGTVLFVSESSRWLVPNMTASFSTTDQQGNEKENSFEGAWFQDNASGLWLLNMGQTTFGRAVNVRLTPQHTGILSPQFVSNAGGYGNLYAYYADYSTGQADSGRSSVCTVTDDNRLVFDNLIIATRRITSSANIRLAASPITYILQGADIIFPEPVEIGFSGTGTPADPYLISTPADLRAMSGAMSQPGYSTAHYRLANDIDMSSETLFEPIGDGETPFNGTFDGNSKTISGLTYNGFGFAYTGLFGVTGNRAVIRDLNISGFSMYSSGANCGILTGSNAGGSISGINVTSSLLRTQSEVAGGIAGMNTGSITSCRVSSTIQGYGASGGITGYNCGEIGNCHYSGQMSMIGALSTSYRHIAGIAAQTLSSASNGFKGHIHDCTASGTITDATGYAYIGGIAAVSHGSKTEDPSVIERCINTATLSATGLDWNSDQTLPKSYCGGIAAYISSTTIEDCANGGLILETSLPKVFTGGVVGIASLTFISGGGEHRLGQVSSVRRVLSAGQIYSASGAGCGIYGAVPVLDPFTSEEAAAMIFTDCVADSQINLLEDDTYALGTAELTSGSLPEGFSPQTWIAAEGRYPVPASVSGTDAGILLAAPVVLATGENHTNVKKNFRLDGAASVRWAILGTDGNLTESTPSLSISGHNAVIGSQYGSNWIVATQGDIVKMLMVSVVPKLFEGSGTAADPFLIRNISDMATLNSAVTVYGQSHRGDSFRMTDDIDASEDPEFVCIGYPVMTRPFQGTFDGNGHAFHNLSVKTAFRTASGGVTGNKSYQYGGLFSHIGTNGTVKNTVIAADCTYDVYSMSGSIAGISFGTIENCRNYAAIGANGMATGGIVGENDGTVTGCYNAGTITIQQNAIKTGAGGIAGANTGLIDLCQNDGDVTIADKKTSEVSGGIAAINYGRIDRSANLGEVRANVKAAGIAATLGSYSDTGEISRCLSLGAVTTVKDNTNGMIANEIRNNSVSGAVYDASLSTVGASLNPLPGCIALSTQELVSGAAPEGIPAEILDLKEGSYPVLRAFAAEPRAALLRSTYIAFAKGQSVANLGSDVGLHSPEGVTWSVSESESFAIDGSTVKVTVPEGDLSAKASVTAGLDGAAVKTYALTSLPVLFDGEGTAEAPYVIRNKEDLATLASFISRNAYDCLNMHYILDADLTYSEDEAFEPVGGDGTTKFNGSFDGNGKTVSGIVYSCTTAKPGKNTGLFGQVGPQGTIHDLTVANTMTGYAAGGVAAQLEGAVYNCVNKGTVASTGDPAGGIVALLKTGAAISGCTNLGSVMSEKAYGTGGIAGKAEAGSHVADCVNKGTLGGNAQGKVLGGIAGMAGGEFTGCRNEGRLVSASGNVGGIIGKHSSGALLEISQCENTAGIYTPKATGVGGIIGGNDTDKSLNKAQVHIYSCRNERAICAVIGVGGIAGIVSESDFIMDNCENRGDIEATNLGAKGFADTFAGGIAGCANGSSAEDAGSYIRDCRNFGNVTAWGGNDIGGITGKNGTPVTECRNSGNVTAFFGGTDIEDTSGFSLSSVGGISGSAYGAVRNSWNSGTVTTDGCWVGGIAGYTNRDITGCANIGDVTGLAGPIAGGSDTQGVAGIVGRMGSVSYAGFISDCYNTGAVTGLTQVAGIVAQRFGNEAQISDVYNTGTVSATASGGTAFPIGNQRSDGAAALPAGSNVYYLEGCCVPSSALDMGAEALGRDALASAELGDAYIHAPGAMPVLADLYDPAPTWFEAIYGIVFTGSDDNASGSEHEILYADFDGLEWTSSENISLSGGIATPTADGTGWMRVTLSEDHSLFRQFEIIVKGHNGVSLTGDDDNILSKEYFDLQGISVAQPVPGTPCVERAVMKDGSVRVRRVMAR